MFELEWQVCNVPSPMLEFLRDKAGDRKLWLYAVACFRRIRQQARRARNSHILHEPKAVDKLERAIEITERFADGEVDEKERAAAWCEWIFAQEDPPTDWSVMRAVVGGTPWYAAGIGCEAWALGDSQACDVLRDIFGNPFRPVLADPSWLTPKVATLARTIYQGQSFDRLPAVADALEKAGCRNADLLAHCRGPGPHVKGCWVVDLISGKE